jgi:hypothetical protein
MSSTVQFLLAEIMVIGRDNETTITLKEFGFLELSYVHFTIFLHVIPGYLQK